MAGARLAYLGGSVSSRFEHETTDVSKAILFSPSVFLQKSRYLGVNPKLAVQIRRAVSSVFIE